MSACCYRGCEGCAEYENAPQTARTALHAARDWRAMPTGEVDAAFRDLAAAIQRVRDYHHKCAQDECVQAFRPHCDCGSPWPCPTISLLDGETQ